jgi:hypothetical protein
MEGDIRLWIGKDLEGSDRGPIEVLLGIWLEELRKPPFNIIGVVKDIRTKLLSNMNLECRLYTRLSFEVFSPNYVCMSVL